ncbi:MAG: dephospho-CoA kinase [Rhizobiales bacterium]|nr:dephospho-CoA kinase [Hyphomicrobiales bacterium]
MIVVGLTGSIAMGKSEAAKMFAAEGVPVFDSDAEVHRMYGKDGDAVTAIQKLYPEAIVDNAVDRSRLSKIVLDDPVSLGRLEAIVHPLINCAQTAFLAKCSRRGDAIAILDVPLLFETGKDADVDKIVVVSAPPAIQRTRALARPGMTEKKYEQILSRQFPDSEKRRRADFIVDTSGDLIHTRAQVAKIVASLKKITESQK